MAPTFVKIEGLKSGPAHGDNVSEAMPTNIALFPSPWIRPAPESPYCEKYIQWKTCFQGDNSVLE